MNKLVDKYNRNDNEYNFDWAKALEIGESVWACNNGSLKEFYDTDFGWLGYFELIQLVDVNRDQVIYLNKNTGKQSSFHWTRIRSTNIEFQVYLESLGINFIHAFPVNYEKTEMYHHFEVLKSKYGKKDEVFEIPVKASGKYLLEQLANHHFYPMVVDIADLKDLKSKLDKIRSQDKNQEPTPDPMKVKRVNRVLVATKKVKPVKAEKPASLPAPSESTKETKDDLIKFRCSKTFKAEVQALAKAQNKDISKLLVEAFNYLKTSV